MDKGFYFKCINSVLSKLLKNYSIIIIIKILFTIKNDTNYVYMVSQGELDQINKIISILET